MKRQNSQISVFLKNANMSSQQQKIAQKICQKLNILSQVAFNIKLAAYRMVQLPVENLKFKIRNDLSVLTTLDFIFYDLKKIQTILQEHSRKLLFNPNQVHTFNASNNHTNSIPNQYYKISAQNLHNNSLYSYDKASKYCASQIGSGDYKFLVDDIKKRDLKRTLKVKNSASSINFIPNKINSTINIIQPATNEISQATYKMTKDKTSDLIKLKDKTFDINKLNDKRSDFQQLEDKRFDFNKLKKGVQINQITSRQQRQNQMVQIEMHQHTFRQQKQLYHSRYKRSQMQVDWNQMQMQQQAKNNENKMFLINMQRKRESYLKNIKLKQRQCFQTIKTFNQKLVAEGLNQSLTNKSLKKRRSRTQKFDKTQAQQDDKKSYQPRY